jgi:integrase
MEADEHWHRDLFKQVLSAAKLPCFVPYDLRHTFASLLLSCNVPLLYVSKQLGHDKPNNPRSLCEVASQWGTTAY